MRAVLLGFSLLLAPACRDDCDPKSKDFVDIDEDGVCDALDVCEDGDDGEDADGDGVPDACDEDLVATFTISDVAMGTSTEKVRVWMAYDASGSLGSWTSIDPGWEFTDEDLQVPIVFSIRDIPAWSRFRDRLTDGDNQEMAFVVEALDKDGVRIVERNTERELNLGTPDLQGKTITSVDVEARTWRTDVSSVITFGVRFFGR